MLLVLAGIYFFQGLSIFSFFLKKKVSPLMRGIALALLFFFFQPLALVLILLGLFDFWFDFRKVKQ